MYNAPCTAPAVAKLIAEATYRRPDGAAGQMSTDKIRAFAKATNLQSYPVDLVVGDLYVFKAR
jgi:hypothetical protein